MERLVPYRVIEIEKSYGVRTRIGAVSRPDAAVVDLAVQAFLVVIAGIRWTHRFARRSIALLAEDGPELEARVRKFAFPVAFDANPMNDALAGRLILSSGRDVVFGAASDDARLAACTTVEIDSHSPLMCHAMLAFFLLFVLCRVLSHSPGEKDQFAFPYPGYLDAGRGPGQCAGFRLDRRRQDAHRIRATMTGIAAEVPVSLPHWHGDDARSDAGREQGGSLKFSVL